MRRAALLLFPGLFILSPVYLLVCSQPAPAATPPPAWPLTECRVDGVYQTSVWGEPTMCDRDGDGFKA